MRKRIQDIFTPLLPQEVIQDSQGIAGLGLRDAIIWLANRVVSPQPSNESISNYDVQGDDQITSYMVQSN